MYIKCGFFMKKNNLLPFVFIIFTLIFSGCCCKKKCSHGDICSGKLQCAETADKISSDECCQAEESCTSECEKKINCCNCLTFKDCCEPCPSPTVCDSCEPACVNVNVQCLSKPIKCYVYNLCNNFTGFYAGIGGGLQYLEVSLSDKSKGRIDVGGGAFYSIKRDKRKKLGDNFGDGEIFLGGGVQFRKSFYFGAEAFFKNRIGKNIDCKLNYDDKHIYFIAFKTPFLTLLNEFSVKRSYEIGGLIRFGILPSPRTMIYLSFGLETTKFKFQKSPKIFFTDYELEPNILIKTNKWRLGIVPGIGLEHMFRNHFSLKAEYTWNCYGDFEINKTFYGSFINTYNFSMDDLIKLKDINSGAFIISLSWYFK